MNPAIGIGIVFGAILAFSIYKTARAVVDLNYTITRFGIYSISKDGVTLRLQIRFTNPRDTYLTVNLVDLAAYLNSNTTTDNNGKLQVVSRGDLLSQYVDASGFVINPNNFTTKNFKFVVRWADLGRLLFNNASAVINAFTNSSSLSQVISAIIGRNVLIYGLVKAENVVVDIASVTNIIDERTA